MNTIFCYILNHDLASFIVILVLIIINRYDFLLIHFNTLCMCNDKICIYHWLVVNVSLLIETLYVCQNAADVRFLEVEGIFMGIKANKLTNT